MTQRPRRPRPGTRGTPLGAGTQTLRQVGVRVAQWLFWQTDVISASLRCAPGSPVSPRPSHFSQPPRTLNSLLTPVWASARLHACLPACLAGCVVPAAGGGPRATSHEPRASLYSDSSSCLLPAETVSLSTECTTERGFFLKKKIKIKKGALEEELRWSRRRKRRRRRRRRRRKME